MDIDRFCFALLGTYLGSIKIDSTAFHLKMSFKDKFISIISFFSSLIIFKTILIPRNALTIGSDLSAFLGIVLCAFY